MIKGVEPKFFLTGVAIGGAFLLGACQNAEARNQTNPGSQTTGETQNDNDSTPIADRSLTDQTEHFLRQMGDPTILHDQYAFGISVEPSTLVTVKGNDGRTYSNVIPDGGLIGRYPFSDTSSFDMHISYSDELFSDFYRTFLTQSGSNPPSAGDHLGKGYLMTFQEAGSVTMAANGVPGAPTAQLEIAEGEQFFAIIVATASETGTTTPPFALDANGDIATSNGQPILVSNNTFEIQQNQDTGSTRGGVGVLLARIEYNEANRTVTLHVIGLVVGRNIYELPPHIEFRKLEDIRNEQAQGNNQ
jgi:hypothetical protein